MGDRGNIAVVSGQGENRGVVWLYSHWGGSRLEETARKVVENSGRIGDPTYLTRQIFCAMVADGFSEGGVRGFDLLRKVAESGDVEELIGFMTDMLGEFASETGAGIGTMGAGDQEHPTVVVDAETGDIWLDERRPWSTEQLLNPELNPV